MHQGVLGPACVLVSSIHVRESAFENERELSATF